AISIDPWRGAISPEMACRSVVLPAPFAPTIAVSEPAANTPDTCSTPTRSRYPTVRSRSVTHPPLTSRRWAPAASRLLGSLIRSAGPWRLSFPVVPSGTVGRTDRGPRRRPARPGAPRNAGLACHPAMHLSADAVDRDECSGHADRFGHGHREEERAAVGARDLRRHQIGAHVLDDVDAVVGEQHLMDR